MDFKPTRNNRLAVYRLTKGTGMSKGKAALELLKNVTTKSDNSSQSSEAKSMEAKRNQMPFYPGVIHLPLTADGKIPTSVLSAEHHRRYVAIISNYLKPDVALRFGLNRLEIQGFDELLVQERLFFETECLKKIESSSNPYAYIHNGSKKLLKERVANRLTCMPAEGFQQLVYTVNWPFDDQSTSGRHCRPVLASVLNDGFSPQIVLPNLRRKCMIRNQADFIKERLFMSEPMPIETDEHAVDFAFKNDSQLIMCASTLRSLLIMPWIYRNQTYSYKVSVRQKLHNGRFWRYIVFSKPLLSSALSKLSLQHKYHKWMVKASLVKDKVVNPNRKRQLSSSHSNEPADKKAAPFVDNELTIKDDGELNESIDEPTVLSDDDATSSQIPDLLGDILKEMDAGVEKPKKKESKVAEPKELPVIDTVREEVPMEKDSAESSRINDLLGDILEGMGGGDFNSTINTIAKSESTKGAGFKKRYSIVDLVTEFAVKQRILIRSTNHGICQPDEEVCITVKSDYIPAIGAERVCEEELLWEFFTATFKGAKTSVNFRMHPSSSNVLQIQRRNVTQFYANLSEGNHRLISQRTERLSTLLDRIKELDLGEYLLMNVGDRMDILSQTVDSETEKVWHAQELKEVGAEGKLLPDKLPTELWQGIDVHLLLVWQFVQGRIPGSLVPPKPDGRDFVPKNGEPSNRGKPFNRGKSFRGKFNRGRGRGKPGPNG